MENSSGFTPEFSFGCREYLQMASRLFEGKNVMKTVKNIINRCELCQKNNPKTEKLAKFGRVARGPLRIPLP